jgi:hypothetical protein
MYGPSNLSYRRIEKGETSIECIWNNGDQSKELIQGKKNDNWN